MSIDYWWLILGRSVALSFPGLFRVSKDVCGYFYDTLWALQTVSMYWLVDNHSPTNVTGTPAVSTLSFLWAFYFLSSGLLLLLYQDWNLRRKKIYKVNMSLHWHQNIHTEAVESSLNSISDECMHLTDYLEYWIVPTNVRSEQRTTCNILHNFLYEKFRYQVSRTSK